MIAGLPERPDRPRQRLNARRLEQGVAADLWSDLKKQSRRLAAVHIQASEVKLYIRKSGKLGELSDAIILDEKAAVPKFQRITSRVSRPAVADIEVAREDKSAFNLPSYILELQQVAAEDKDIDDMETYAAGVGLVDIGSGLGAAAAAAIAPLWDGLIPDANGAQVSASNDASPRAAPRRHLTIAPAPELPSPSPSTPLVPLIETIPQHYPSDLLWEHSHFMMSAQQVRWEMGRDGIRPKPMRSEFASQVCGEGSAASRPGSAAKQRHRVSSPATARRTSPSARPTTTMASTLEVATPVASPAPPQSPGGSGHVPQGVMPRTLAMSPRYARAERFARKHRSSALAQAPPSPSPVEAEAQSHVPVARRILSERLVEWIQEGTPTQGCSPAATPRQGSPVATPRNRLNSICSSRPASAESRGHLPLRSDSSSSSSVTNMAAKRSVTPHSSTNHRRAPSPMRRS